jgi:hypothetical protein
MVIREEDQTLDLLSMDQMTISRSPTVIKRTFTKQVPSPFRPLLKRTVLLAETTQLSPDGQVLQEQVNIVSGWKAPGI